MTQTYVTFPLLYVRFVPTRKHFLHTVLLHQLRNSDHQPVWIVSGNGDEIYMEVQNSSGSETLRRDSRTRTRTIGHFGAPQPA